MKLSGVQRAALDAAAGVLALNAVLIHLLGDEEAEHRMAMARREATCSPFSLMELLEHEVDRAARRGL